MNALEAQARAVFTDFGYAKGTIKWMLEIEKTLVRLHTEQGEEQWSKDIVSDYIKSKENCYQNGKIGINRFNDIRNATRKLAEIFDTGTIVPKTHSYYPELLDSFKQVLSELLANDEWNHKTQRHQYNHASVFFRWLEAQGHRDLSSVDDKVVREYLTDCSTRLVGYSFDNTRRALKKLFLFLSGNGVLSAEMSKLFLFKIPIEKKIKPYMPQDEIAAVLNVIDKNTKIGKRDYAIILLTAVTGLRRVDIVTLTLDSIDWRNGEIRIVQEKTGKALALSLTTDAGRAIQEYITNARPRSKSNKVFLNTQAPFSEMHPSTLNIILKGYCIKAGLKTHWGFHSLRRSIATNMITTGTSVITAAQVLGKTTIDSMKPYISLDSKNLKECALDFSGILPGGDRR